MKLKKLKELFELYGNKFSWTEWYSGYNTLEKIKKFILEIENELKNKTLNEDYFLTNKDIFHLIKFLPVVTDLDIVINIQKELEEISSYHYLLYNYRQNVITENNYDFFCKLSDESLNIITKNVKESFDFGILLRKVSENQSIKNAMLFSFHKHGNLDKILNKINILTLSPSKKYLLDEKFLIKKLLPIPKLTVSSQIFNKPKNSDTTTKINSLPIMNKATSAYHKYNLLRAKNHVQDVSMPSMNEENLKSYKSSN